MPFRKFRIDELRKEIKLKEEAIGIGELNFADLKKAYYIKCCDCDKKKVIFVDDIDVIGEFEDDGCKDRKQHMSLNEFKAEGWKGFGYEARGGWFLYPICPECADKRIEFNSKHNYK